MARTRSDSKRSQIIRVAAEAFAELGYERTSMLTIAERMRGSKQTLYNYFPSKDDLLRAVLDFDVSEVSSRALEEFLREDDVRKALIRLGRLFLEGQLGPRAISNFRIVACQPPESGIGEEFFTSVLRVAWQRAADAFQSLMDKGKLRQADPYVAAMHFRGLALQDLFERRLLNARKMVPPAQIKAAAIQAADAFLCIYAPRATETGAPSEPAARRRRR